MKRIVQRKNITNGEGRVLLKWRVHDDLSAKKIISKVRESVLVSDKLAPSLSLSGHELFLISLYFYVVQREVAGELQSLIIFVRLINDRGICGCVCVCIGKLDSIGWGRWISSFHIY